MSKLQFKTAKVFRPLLEPARYKGAHGGRGSGKSHFFAELLLEDHLLWPGLRSVCIREIQKSIKQSAKRLIEDKIECHRLQLSGFKIFNEVIETPGSGLIVFQGMQDHTSESIKSLEGFGRAWIEEAQTLSAFSLQLLRPTIRAPGSQIWASWNPRRKNDPIDVLLRGAEKPSDAIVVEANWRDNPFFTPELEQERLDDLRINPDQYPHIWEGGYATAQSGAYFAKQLAEARTEGRIGVVRRDKLMSVRAFFDIGGTGAVADACAIWIVQFIGKEIRVIDYYEAVGQELSEHVAWLRSRGYEDARVYLPHDGVTMDKVYRVSYESKLRDAGFAVEVIGNQGKGAASQRIEAVRRVFPSLWFDKERCEAGLEALGWYHEKIDPARNVGLGPEHDWSSHGCDAAGLMAIVAEHDTKDSRRLRPPRESSDWRT